MTTIEQASTAKESLVGMVAMYAANGVADDRAGDYLEEMIGHLRHLLHDELGDDPAMVLVPEVNEDDVEYVAAHMRCPGCGGVELREIDVAERWNTVEDVTDAGMLPISVGDSGDYEGAGFFCEGCNTYLSLPETAPEIEYV